MMGWVDERPLVKSASSFNWPKRNSHKILKTDLTKNDERTTVPNKKIDKIYKLINKACCHKED